MKESSKLTKRLITTMVASGLIFGVGAGITPVAYAADTAALEAQIAELSSRLNTMENELAVMKKAEKVQAQKTKKLEKDSKKGSDIRWYGSTKTGYWSDSTGNSKVKAEGTIFGNKEFSDGYGVTFGLKYKSTTGEPQDVYKLTQNTKKAYQTKHNYSSEKNKIKLEAFNLHKTFGADKRLLLTAGVMQREIGEGMWIGKSSINGFAADYKITPNDRVSLFYGRDGQDYLVNDIAQDTDPASQTRLLKYIDYSHNFTKKAYLGVYAGSQEPETYLGVYGATPIVGKWWISGEYAHNGNTTKPLMNAYSYGYDYTGAKASTNGYMFAIHYGHAKKAGEWDIMGQWMNVDQNFMMNANYTDPDDYLDAYGYKGFGLIGTYMLSDRTKLQLLRYWASNKPDSRNLDSSGYAEAKETYNTFYLKLTSKF